MVIEYDTLTISGNGALPSVPFLDLKEKILGKKYELSIVFTTPAQAVALNKQYRNKDYVPNTLSFPLTKSSGELIITRSVALKQCKDFNLTYNQYIIYLLIHSMLHLKGFDHGSTMDTKEIQLMKYFKIQFTHEAKHNSRN